MAVCCDGNRVGTLRSSEGLDESEDDSLNSLRPLEWMARAKSIFPEIPGLLALHVEGTVTMIRMVKICRLLPIGLQSVS